MNLKDFVDRKSYHEFAGDAWPRYEEFISGTVVTDPKISQEISEFLDIMKSRVSDLRIDKGIELADENKQRQGHVYYDKEMKHGIRCNVPWETMGINANGQVFICMSPSWVPKFVGSILEAETIFDVLNTKIATDVRKEILLGRYFYCNEKLCTFFGNLPKDLYEHSPRTAVALQPDTTDSFVNESKVTKIPSNIVFDFDLTCNFKCPSCRTEVINTNKHHLIRPINDRIVQKIKTLILDKLDHNVTIRWAGGEPFISASYLEIFDYIIENKIHQVSNIIQTNGSCLHLPVFKKLLPYIQELRISFDAATSETYQQIRVNGDWDKLINNVKYAKKLITENNLNTKLTADFVVQKDNYREIPQFVSLCKELGITRFNLQKMWNWGTWDLETFNDKNIYNPAHPEYHMLCDVFKQANQPIQN